MTAPMDEIAPVHRISRR